MTNLIALPQGTELVGDYRITRVLGAGGFGITYLAEEIALARKVTIKEYFPADFAARKSDSEAAPRSADCAGDYKWGLDRFIEEAQTLAKFSHPNIVRVYRYFRANNTGYMVLHFEEGQSLKSWLKGLGRAPRQKELDRIVPALLDALEMIHKADFLHRDIAPDNIIIRDGGEPVLIDFGSARGEIAAHSKTVSALVKPGYSPYEQYAERSSQQGPWTDIYALAATLYHAVTGKRPPDSPSRVVKDEMMPAREAAVGAFRAGFLDAIDKALSLAVERRPKSVAEWRGALLAPDPPKPGWLGKGQKKKADEDAVPPAAAAAVVPPLPDVPAPQGHLLDYVDSLKRPAGGDGGAASASARAAADARPAAPPAAVASSAATEKIAEAPTPKPLFGRGRNKASPPVADAAKAAPPPPAEPAAARKSAAASPAAGALPVPVQVPAQARRAPPRPSRSWSAPRFRPLLFKLVIGAGIASAAVAMQDKLPQFSAPEAPPGPARPSKAGERQQAATPPAQVEAALQPTAPLGQLTGHRGAVTAVRYTDDGRSIVTAGEDGTLRVWSAATGSLSRTIPTDHGPVRTISLAGTQALTGHADGLVLLWDLDRGDRPKAFRRNEADIWSVTFAGEPGRFATSSHDWKVALWDAAAGQAPLHVFDGHESAAQSVAFHPRSRLLASGSADRTVKLWSLDTLDLVRTYRGHRDFVTALAFSPDGKTLAAATLDGAIRLWSTSSGSLKRTLSGHKRRVTGLAFSADGDKLASAAEDGTVRLWDVRRGRTQRTLVAHAGAVNAVAFSPDDQRVAAAGDDGIVRIWSAQTYALRRGD